LEEMFHVLEGEVDVTIRGRTSKANTGETINLPAVAFGERTAVAT
jgi:quercetin dioxygenase-like cupin family protein